MKRLILFSLLILFGCESITTEPDKIFTLKGKWQAFQFAEDYEYIPLEIFIDNDNNSSLKTYSIEYYPAEIQEYDIQRILFTEAVNPVMKDVKYDFQILAKLRSNPLYQVQIDGNIKLINDEYIMVGHMFYQYKGITVAGIYTTHLIKQIEIYAKKQSITYLPKEHDQGTISNGY